MITKKHFEALADALRATKPGTNLSNSTQTALYRQWVSDVRAIRDVCVSFNSNFKSRRFEEACGYEKE